MKPLYVGVATAVLALASTSAAAEAPVGPRVEVLGGFDILRAEIPGVFSPTVKLEDTGILYGIGAGFDFAVSDGISLGADVEVSRSTAKLNKRFLEALEYEEGTADLIVRAKPSWDGYVGGRLSFGLGTNSNVYVKGGYTRLKVRTSARFVDHATGDSLAASVFNPLDLADLGGRFSDSSHLNGWRIGGGGQVGFGGGAYVGTEVRYSNYEQNVSRWQGALTLGYRFGGEAPPPPVVEAPPPPPPPPPPQTQTCVDGSVILATDVCPSPPPPPPPPPPAPERG